MEVFTPRSSLLTATVVAGASLQAVLLLDMPADAVRFNIPLAKQSPWFAFLELLALCLSVPIFGSLMLAYNYAPSKARQEWHCLGFTLASLTGFNALVIFCIYDSVRVIEQWNYQAATWYLLTSLGALTLASDALYGVVFVRRWRQGEAEPGTPHRRTMSSVRSVDAGSSQGLGAQGMQVFSNPVAMEVRGGSVREEEEAEQEEGSAEGEAAPSNEGKPAAGGGQAVQMPTVDVTVDGTAAHSPAPASCTSQATPKEPPRSKNALWAWFDSTFLEDRKFQYAPWVLTAAATTLVLILYFFFLLLELAHRQSSALLAAQIDLASASRHMAEYRAILEQQTELAERILDDQTRLMQASLAAGRNVSANSTQGAEENLAGLHSSVAELTRLSSTFDSWTAFLDRLNATLGVCLILGASLGLAVTLLQLAQFLARHKRFSLQLFDLKKAGGPAWTRFLQKHGGETLSEVFQKHDLGEATYLLVMLVASAAGVLILWAALFSGASVLLSNQNTWDWVLLYWPIILMLALLKAANMLLRRFVGNRLATDGQNIQHPYVWMLFFFALSFTQLLEGLIFGALRLVWLLLLNLCSALRLDKAIYPVLKATDMGYQAYMGNALFEVAANNFSSLPDHVLQHSGKLPGLPPGAGRHRGPRPAGVGRPAQRGRRTRSRQ
eukprot:jgi/Tetstr1/421697/TSEL_012635.t1